VKLIALYSDSPGAFSMPLKNTLKWAAQFIGPILLPILFGIIPTLYHYSNNVEKLVLANLSRMLLFNVLLVFVFYLFIALFNRFHAIRTAVMTFVFLIFFNIYGLAYRYLIDLDVIRLKHYTFLPLVLMFVIYILFPIGKLKNSALGSIWKNLVHIAGLLVLYNLINIVPAEIKRWSTEETISSTHAQENPSVDENAPDIYYIILDEFAGFQAMREYWHYNEVDDFVSFLKERGFFVAEESHGSSTDTLHQMATRLNYQEYPLGDEYIQTYFNDIADNQVVRYLESRGYTIVVFDETNLGYPSAKPIPADYYYEYGSSAIPENATATYGFYFEEFGELVMDNTMVYAISQKFSSTNPAIILHSNMIHFTVDHIADKEIPSPKFVYAHLLLPHTPFAFAEDGSIMGSDRFTNWNYYIETYKFSINVATEMVNRILSEADPENPPVIILQSDHGARNELNRREGNMVLPNYPEKHMTHIMYVLLVPGYDYSSLPQDINPVNTFPIVFNHLFDDNIPLIK
jgi:hypothetical protein